MMRILKVTAIFIKLLLAADNDKRTAIATGDDKTMVRAPVDDKKYKTTQIDNDVYHHTEKYKGKCDDTEYCYCVISEKHLELLSGLERTHLDAGRKGAAVVKLERLLGSDNPRKWIDSVISHSSGEKMPPMKKEEFIGTAVYAQRYIVANTDGEKTLFDNLFNLFIRDAILNKRIDDRSTFYSDIYADINDERALLLLEDFMKTVIKKVLAGLGMEFSIDGEDLNIYSTDRDCNVNDYCDKRDELRIKSKDDLRIKSKDSTAFKNVIMKRRPTIKSRRYGYILLTLIGMIRSGKHVISARCEDWVPRSRIKKDSTLRVVISLVNTNRNLAGIAELEEPIGMGNLDELLGDVKEQLRYFEFRFGDNDSRVSKAIKFIEGLSDVELKVVIYYPVFAVKKWLSKIPQAIKSLDIRIFQAGYYQDALKGILESENVRRLELFCYDMTLEGFLMGIYKSLMTGEGKLSSDNLRSKLKMVAVTNLGNLSSEEISDKLLGDLGLERLVVSIDINGVDLSNLAKRGITTGDRLRYLVIANVNERNIQRVVDLKRLMGSKREWPVLLTNYRQIQTFDYARTSSYYEIVDPETK